MKLISRKILNHFSVEDLDAIIARAKQKGVKIVRDIFEEQDEFGKVRYVPIYIYLFWIMHL